MKRYVIATFNALKKLRQTPYTIEAPTQDIIKTYRTIHKNTAELLTIPHTTTRQIFTYPRHRHRGYFTTIRTLLTITSMSCNQYNNPQAQHPAIYSINGCISSQEGINNKLFKIRFKKMPRYCKFT